MKHPTIKENHLFGKVYKQGKAIKGRYTVVYVLRDLAYGKLLRRDPHRKSFNRVGLTVTKTIGGAVVRSRVRRILRAGLTEAEKRKMTEGKLIVICARNAAANAKSTDIAKELISHFEKLGLYLKTSPKLSAGKDAGGNAGADKIVGENPGADKAADKSASENAEASKPADKSAKENAGATADANLTASKPACKSENQPADKIENKPAGNPGRENSPGAP